ncbi:hypothetical protein HK102_012044 [Quaeritorhiza haematococci]|nr:hypothetical protein HK102_012044 [Quaeritorhiza haematococci]
MILVLGYFKRGNLGDELFATIWTHLLAKAKVPHTIMSFEDDFSCFQIRGFEAIVLAGGDLVNEYFMKKLRQILKNSRRIPIYGISLGVPWWSGLEKYFVQCLSYISVRAKTCLPEIQDAVGLDRCMYHPDISIYLPRMYQDSRPRNVIQRYKRHPERRNVGVFLTRTIFGSNPRYPDLVKNMGRSLTRIVDELNAEIFFIAFNTNESSAHGCDHYVARDVYAHMDPTLPTTVHVIEEALDAEAMWCIFRDDLDFNICMHFHSHMYSLMAKKPFVSLSMTNKTKWLMEEAGEAQRTYFLPLDVKARPTAFDPDHFLDLFRTHFGKPMSLTIDWQDEQYQGFEEFLFGLLESKTLPSKSLYRSDNERVADAIDRVVTYGLGKDGDLDASCDILSGKTSIHDFMRDRNKTCKAEFLAQLVLLSMTGDASSEFLYGLTQKILTPTFDGRSELEWIAQHSPITQTHAPTATPYFALTARTNLKGLHRSGWQYVMSKLATFSDDHSDLLLDNYVDRTFHWMHDLYQHTGAILYRKPWIGFVHHTYDTSYSQFSVPELFVKPLFLRSLEKCKGLLCLSQDLAKKVRRSLADHDFGYIPVHSLVHPTEFVDDNFTMAKFLDNPERLVIQIGAWLRDSYAIHELDLAGSNPLKLQKAALRGKCMGNHFAPEDLALRIQAKSIDLDATVHLNQDVNQGLEGGSFNSDWHSNTMCRIMCRGSMCRDHISNKYIQGMVRSVTERHASVKIIETVSNEDYDALLSHNLVFLKLVDTSTVNTLIECVVRNTPILINPIPSVVELLGPEYPFYYDTLHEAVAKLGDLAVIKAAHVHLQHLDKQSLKLDHFARVIENICLSVISS